MLVAAPLLAAQETDESALDQFEQARPVPATDSPASVELRDAVRRMAQRPTDPVALSDAGHASLKLGDAAAALNFFTRANAVQPNNPRTLAGLGSAMVRTENPFEALKYFDDAVKLGASERSIAFDRALAFDLLGNFARAQQDYQLARGYADADELTRRHAMSLSMAGKAKEADAMLVPLLQRNDPEAWRARAFMLASRGEQKEATQIAQGFLPADAARRMEGYLRQMPRMTDAQRAAAMHFGHFPAGRIGEDSPEVRKLAAATATGPSRPASPATGQDRLVPAGEPLGGTGKKSPAKKTEDRAPRVATSRQAGATDPKPGFSTPEAQRRVEEAAKAKPVVLASASLPPPDSARAPVRVTLPPPVRSDAPPATVPAVQPAPTVAVATARPPADARVEQRPAAGPVLNASTLPASSPALPPQSASVTQAPRPVQVASAQPALPQSTPSQTSMSQNATAVAESDTRVVSDPQPSPPPAIVPAAAQTVSAAAATIGGTVSAPTPQPRPFDLGAIVQSIEIPESEQRPTVAPVDLRAIERRQAAAAAATPAASNPRDPKTGKPKAEPKAPPQPARIWVQIATGAEAALPTDYRRMSRKAPALFKGQTPWTSDWGRTSRLLVGPFADNKAAKKWEAEFKKEFGDAFVWQSANGTVVEKLAVK